MFLHWTIDIELSDCLLDKYCHRYNQHISENYRLGFPKIDQYNTWLIDILQVLFQRNQSVLLYSEWSNTSDYIPIDGSFGTIALHTEGQDTQIS